MLKKYLIVFLGLLLPVKFLAAVDALTAYLRTADILGLLCISGAGFALLAVAAYLVVQGIGSLLVYPVSRENLRQHLQGLGGFFLMSLAWREIVGGIWVWTSVQFAVDPSVSEFAAALHAAKAAGAGIFAALWWRWGTVRWTAFVDSAIGKLKMPAFALGAFILIAPVALVPFLSTTLPPPESSLNTPVGRPMFVLITMDTFSASHSNLWGATLETTPELKRLAESSIVFDEFESAANFTTSSFASIFSGTYPWTHRVIQVRHHLRPDLTRNTLAGELKAAGFTLASFTGNWWAHPRHVGHESAWDYVSGDLTDSPKTISDTAVCSSLVICDVSNWFMVEPYKFILQKLDDYADYFGFSEQVHFPPYYVTGAGKSWLSEHQAQLSQHPGLVWFHTVSPHDPFNPETPYRQAFLKSNEFLTVAEQKQVKMYALGGVDDETARLLSLRYKEYMLYTDHYIGDLMSFLDKSGVLDRAWVIIAADHGENFTRNYVGHGGPLLTEEVIHVPLIIRPPGGVASRRIATPVSQVDLMPTILDIAGLPIPSGLDGRSLKPLLDGLAMSDVPLFSMDFERESSFADLRRGSIAVIEGRWKFVAYLNQPYPQLASDELYDLAADPAETHNLIRENATDAARLKQLILDRLALANRGYRDKSGASAH